MHKITITIPRDPPYNTIPNKNTQTIEIFFASSSFRIKTKVHSKSPKPLAFNIIGMEALRKQSQAEWYARLLTTLLGFAKIAKSLDGKTGNSTLTPHIKAPITRIDGSFICIIADIRVWIKSKRSSMYMLNNRGPKTDPWGTPRLKSFQEPKKPFT